jgi:hypothetical protein
MPRGSKQRIDIVTMIREAKRRAKGQEDMIATILMILTEIGQGSPKKTTGALTNTPTDTNLLTAIVASQISTKRIRTLTVSLISLAADTGDIQKAAPQGARRIALIADLEIVIDHGHLKKLLKSLGLESPGAAHVSVRTALTACKAKALYGESFQIEKTIKTVLKAL